MEQIRLTSNEFILYSAIAGGIMGLILGFIILILGFIKKERSYAVFGFLGSVILGPISGILSLIIAVIFIWLILRRPKNKAANSTVSNESFNENVPESKSSSDANIS
jgi:uncharacterized membrane protein